MRKIFILVSLCSVLMGYTQSQEDRWNILSDTAIARTFSGEASQAYKDNIEMAGKKVAAIVSYEIDSLGKLSVSREVFFPQLHPYIKETDPSWYVYRSYLKKTFADNILPKLYVGNKEFAPGPIKKVLINGKLLFEHNTSVSGLKLDRSFYPSMSERLFVEQLSLTNATDSVIRVTASNSFSANMSEGKDGQYQIIAISSADEQTDIAPGETYSFLVNVLAKHDTFEEPEKWAPQAEKERDGFLSKMNESLRLETPDSTLNTLFEFSKIRASESIYDSKLGLIHSPGGGRYYVGIWANDQAEYVSPFFSYLGYGVGHQSAVNMYRAFAGEMNDEYTKLPYAFEVEGLPPPSPLDRGDAAMIAYGASQYALATGDKKVANQLWPLITWCLEYCKRQLNEAGVVKSETDEMENRIETGTANLATSSLYYGALLHAADLAKALEKYGNSHYRSRAKKLKNNIETYFGATIDGLNTYRYYDGHQTLRHWICLPLVVGINDRKEDTIEALFDRLWSDKGGVHVEKNNPDPAISNIFWDRGTLYALRGTFIAGATDISLEKLQQFSQERLLGARVPYVIEAFPEGSMAHLSAESGLYCRVFIEGMFGITPTGLDSFTCMPRLPQGWDEMALRNIRAFGKDFDLKVSRVGALSKVEIIDNESGKTLLNKTTALDKPISYRFKGWRSN